MTDNVSMNIEWLKPEPPQEFDPNLVEMALLKWLHRHPGSELWKVQREFLPEFRNQFPKGYHVQSEEVVWSLIRQGYIYLRYSNSSATTWHIGITDKGKIAVQEGEFNPYSTEEYMSRLRATIPAISGVVLQYASEALVSFRDDCFLASAVMLGVASEAAFLEMAQSFGNWLATNGQGQEGQSFLQIINSQKTNYITKFAEFRKKIETHKPKLPNELSDGMALTFDSVLDLLRIYRNDSGHPTGKQIDRADAFINMQMFARYVEKLYQFKAHFDITI